VAAGMIISPQNEQETRPTSDGSPLRASKRTASSTWPCAAAAGPRATVASTLRRQPSGEQRGDGDSPGPPGVAEIRRRGPSRCPSWRFALPLAHGRGDRVPLFGDRWDSFGVATAPRCRRRGSCLVRPRSIVVEVPDSLFRERLLCSHRPTHSGAVHRRGPERNAVEPPGSCPISSGGPSSPERDPAPAIPAALPPRIATPRNHQLRYPPSRVAARPNDPYGP